MSETKSMFFRLVAGLYDRLIGKTKCELERAQFREEILRAINVSANKRCETMSNQCYEHYQRILVLEHRIRCMRAHFRTAPRKLPLP